MPNKHPVIGILTYGRRDVAVENFLYDEYYATPAFYVDAVRRAGGLPVLLPPAEPNLADWLDTIDGFVFTGGTDIDAKHYGGNADNPALLIASQERDDTEFSLLNLLMENGKIPTLFICRGMQLLNIALGGTLTEHIPDIMDTDIHRGDDGGWTVQPVDVKPSTKLAQIMGATHVKTYSGHHQAIKTVAPSLQETATAPDGIAEGLELTDHPFFVAVQWHPEVSAKTDETQQSLFDALVNAAR